jgi:hypothetical protein
MLLQPPLTNATFTLPANMDDAPWANYRRAQAAQQASGKQAAVG